MSVYDFNSKNYKLSFVFSIEGEYKTAGKDLYYRNASEAFIRAILILKQGVRGDLISAVAEEGSTRIYFEEDKSLQIIITPNILSEGTERIGPYSFKYAMMASEFPEN